jgi:carbonic anhydrase/acetyltransferase-like protein (isoleucine patch superfamily)
MIYSLADRTPEIAEGCFVAPTAVVVGKVRVDAGASIWWGAVLRGDNELIHICAGSNVQENTVIHTDIGHPCVVHERVTIGHQVTLHGCTVGENSLIGIGAIVLNGAKIGKNCLVGAGSLVPEGKEIPDGSLVIGSPAKVVRTLDSDVVERLKSSSAHYVEKAALFREQLQRID